MPSVLRYEDTAGGGALGKKNGKKTVANTTVLANSKEIIVDSDDVENHGSSPHNAATITAVSNNVFIGGIAVANSGDKATCNHAGSSNSSVKVGNPKNG